MTHTQVREWGLKNTFAGPRALLSRNYKGFWEIINSELGHHMPPCPGFWRLPIQGMVYLLFQTHSYINSFPLVQERMLSLKLQPDAALSNPSLKCGIRPS